MRMVLQILILAAALLYAVLSVFWTGWADHLTPIAQYVLATLFGLLVVFELVLFASPTFNDRVNQLMLRLFARLLSPRA